MPRQVAKSLRRRDCFRKEFHLLGFTVFGSRMSSVVYVQKIFHTQTVMFQRPEILKHEAGGVLIPSQPEFCGGSVGL